MAVEYIVNYYVERVLLQLEESLVNHGATDISYKVRNLFKKSVSVDFLIDGKGYKASIMPLYPNSNAIMLILKESQMIVLYEEQDAAEVERRVEKMIQEFTETLKKNS